MLLSPRNYSVAVYPRSFADSFDHICVAIAFKRDGIDFGAIDSQPSTVFVCMLYPQAEGVPHLEMLAYIAGKLGSAERVAKLLACAGPQDVLWFMRNE